MVAKMDFSVQNKKFLAHLNKLGIDYDQFSDKSFDGLFENTPDSINYFFNWFMENVTSDNILTELEQASYFESKCNQLLPTEEELLTQSSPSFEELQSVDVNYLKNFLLKDLEELKQYCKDLDMINSDLELNQSEVKKKHLSSKEDCGHWKKQLVTVKHNNHNISAMFSSKVDDVKTFVLTEPYIGINLESCTNLLMKEEEVFNNFSCNFLGNNLLGSTNVELLTKIEEDLSFIDLFIIFSEGALKEGKAKIEKLGELLHKQPGHDSFDICSGKLIPSNSVISESVIGKEVQALENELQEKVKALSCIDVQKIKNEYLEMRIDLNKSSISKLIICQDFFKLNSVTSLWLNNIITKSIECLEDNMQLRKYFLSKLNHFETNFSDNISNFELRKQRFKEVSSHSEQHPLLQALKNVWSPKSNTESNEETLRNVIEIITQANDDSNFPTYSCRTKLQSSIKSLFNNVLCGPTSQLLFVPIDLLIKFQNCEQCGTELSQEIKRLANKYVEAKGKISQTDRKKLLLWMDFLSNPLALQEKMKKIEES